MTQGARDVSREKDDQVLHWITLRKRGHSPIEIARKLKYPGAHTDINNTIGRVQKADIAEAEFWGETPEEVAAQYWPRMRNRK